MASPPDRPVSTSPESWTVGSRIEQEAVEAAARVFGRLLASVDGDLAPQWLPDPAQEDVLRLVGRCGEAPTVHVWVHSTSGATIHGLQLRMTDLVAADGRIVPGSAGGLEPQVLAVLPRRTVASVLRVSIPHETAPGSYTGQVVSTRPTALVAVELAVVP